MFWKSTNANVFLFTFITAIKSALKQENLNPEIEEKLLQLQRYQEKRMKPEQVERETRAVAVAAHSPSPPPRRRATSSRNDDDDEWVDSSPRKRSRARPPTPPPAPRAPPPLAARAPSPAPPAPAPAPSAPQVTHTPISTLEERRRAVSTHSRLQMLLFKHKEMLKKDIIKKRGLLEKELGVEIQVGPVRAVRINTRYIETLIFAIL